MSSFSFERIQLASMSNNMTFLILISLLLSSHIYLVTASGSEVADETPFTYVEGTGKGPKEWGQINALCDEGKSQSPIDIPDQQVKVSPDLGDLKREYKPAPAIVKYGEQENAMFLQVIWKAYAGKININRNDYNLIQYHWHSPSEHTINGIKFELELHSVYNSSSGQEAVIATVYEYGPPDAFLSKLLPYIQSIGKEEQKEAGIVNPGDAELGSREYYRYIGSLTVPPCTEDVIWTIIKKAGTVSKEQITALRESVSEGFKGNARPIQPLNGRPVLLYTPKNK